MELGLLTYNILFNRALLELGSTIKELKPAVICFQEIETLDENLLTFTKFDYELADSSNSFIKFGKIFGLATYYDPNQVTVLNSESFDLPRSVLEAFLVILRGGNNPRSVLKTEFLIKKTKKRVTVYNIHLSPWGSNGVRLKQIYETFESLELPSTNNPIIIAGDFNFPYGRKKLEEMIRQYSLKEATDSLFFTLESKFLKIIPVRLKLDYILYRSLRLLETKKVELRHSDHFPIYSRFSTLK